MKVSDFFARAFGKKQNITLKMQLEEQITEVYFKELATACAVNMIASTIAKCEIRTFLKNEPQKKEEYFLWNYSPNQNENGSDMLQKLITNLCYDNEALVVELNGNLYVAEYFTRTQYALYDDIFSDIVINGITLQKKFVASEVIYMQLNNIDVKQRLEGSYTSYGQTIAKAIRQMIRANGQKGILDIDAQTSAQTDFAEKLQTLMNDRFKPFFEANQAVLPLTSGYKYTDVTKATTAPTPADLNERINYEFELAGRAYRIPKSLILGDVSDVEKITKNFLTFAVDPICEKLGEEITRKRYGVKQFAKGNYVDINTNCIQHIDVFEQSTNAEGLLRSGLYCIDELRAKLGDTPLKTEWSQKHYITKNYTEAEQMNHLGKEGGE